MLNTWAVEVAAFDHYVSRAAHKLVAALDAFPIEVAGRMALDMGASTGGFTDCVLQRGALKVYAYDVGTNQLADFLDCPVVSDQLFSSWHIDAINIRVAHGRRRGSKIDLCGTGFAGHFYDLP